VTNVDLLEQVIGLVKERCNLLPDFVEQAGFFFQPPTQIDTESLLAKWNEAKLAFFQALLHTYANQTDWSAASLETQFKDLAATHAIKVGELMLPLRIMLVGGKFGPGVFDIAALIGKEETLGRLKFALSKC